MEKTISNEIYEKINEAKKISTIYPEKSFELSKEAYNIARINNLKIEEGYSLISMAFSCRANSEVNKILDYSLKALEIFEDANEPAGQIRALNLIGIAYFYNSMYEDALKYLLQANEMLHFCNDDFLLSCVLNNIGEVYRESIVNDKAKEFYNEALRICTDNDYRLNTAATLGNIGEIYFKENKFTEALDYFNKSYNILIEEKDMISLGEAENRLGKVYCEIGRFNEAEEYLNCSLNRLDNVNNRYYAVDALVNMAKLNLEKNSNKSIELYKKAIHYAEMSNASKKLSEVYKLISEYYEKKEDFKNALEYYKKHSLLNEEIMTSNLGNKLEILKIELEHLKESDKFEKVKMMLEKEIQIQKNELFKIKKSNEILEKEAYEDELTGIPNRRYINSYLNKIWKNSIINDETIVLFMIDIDNFKKFNDYWGHSYGDECLKKVAKCLKEIQEKREDIIGRYGGEEFIYVARNIDFEQALELGDQLRIEVEKLDLCYKYNDKSSSITISIGGAIGKAADFKCFSNLIEISDNELYIAKDLGRNNTRLKKHCGTIYA